VYKCRKLKLIDVMDVVVSEATESPALLCESPKSHESSPGRHHVIRTSNLPKTTEYGLPYHNIPGATLAGANAKSKS
jgi:hypothetical protein